MYKVEQKIEVGSWRYIKRYKSRCDVKNENKVLSKK